ncbi:hypothetical protein [Bacillus sp. ISL-55]|uniref:hypothetical protein n=1 Tax=Bacillus sp. ISL-55 TaxID=2819134 RepID=UPI001BEB6CDC|nr:hypothetical protein [Bacillus sp. ISL-55]
MKAEKLSRKRWNRDRFTCETRKAVTIGHELRQVLEEQHNNSAINSLRDKRGLFSYNLF